MTLREFEQIVVALQELPAIAYAGQPYLSAEAVCKIMASHLEEPALYSLQFRTSTEVHV